MSSSVFNPEFLASGPKSHATGTKTPPGTVQALPPVSPVPGTVRAVEGRATGALTRTVRPTAARAVVIASMSQAVPAPTPPRGVFPTPASGTDVVKRYRSSPALVAPESARQGPVTPQEIEALARYDGPKIHRNHAYPVPREFQKKGDAPLYLSQKDGKFRTAEELVVLGFKFHNGLPYSPEEIAERMHDPIDSKASFKPVSAMGILPCRDAVTGECVPRVTSDTCLMVDGRVMTSEQVVAAQKEHAKRLTARVTNAIRSVFPW